MSFEIFDFITSYGYLAVFIGSIFEGESVLLLAGALSHGEYLSFTTIILCAFLGAIAGDTTWFLLGRYHGVALLAKRKWLNTIMGKPMIMVNKNPVRLAFLMRFMYGFRHVVPFSLGMSTIPTKVFLLWNSLGALCWSVAFVSVGFIFINIIEELVGNLKRYEFRLVILVVLVIVIISTVGRMLKKAVKKQIIEEVR